MRGSGGAFRPHHLFGFVFSLSPASCVPTVIGKARSKVLVTLLGETEPFDLSAGHCCRP